MDQIIYGLQPRCVILYIKDITVYSWLLEKPACNLKEVFLLLENASLQVSVRKKNLANYLIIVLGHRMLASVIEPDPHKVLAVRCMPPSPNIT